MTDMTFWQFTIPKIPLYALSTLVVCVVGEQLQNVHSLKDLKIDKGMSSAEKLHFALEVILTLITIGFIVWSGIVFKGKMDSYKRLDE